MIAELHGKISSTGSNLNDRLEDNLTGDIFGSLRYLPFDLGIAPILSAARIQELSKLMEESGPPPYKMVFWPYHPLGELDVRIDLDNAVIGIEVKYQSPLSSDDEADYEIEAQRLELEEVIKIAASIINMPYSEDFVVGLPQDVPDKGNVPTEYPDTIIVPGFDLDESDEPAIP